ncbi:MAG: PRC-barrel domain-containing protein, partial [Planctomycetes bacterium]|nr:PRC-barrel domain-containing protein [Planctomycetota bacterium]
MAILSDESKIVITTVLGVGLAGLPLTGQAEQGARAQEAAVQRHHVQLLERGTLVGAVVNNGREGDKKAKLGSIADLVIDATDGAVRYAVLESGATLGIGGRRTAVAWNSLTWDTNSRQFSLSIT